MTLWQKLCDYQTSIEVSSIILLPLFSNPNFPFLKKFSSLDSTILAFCERLDFKSSPKYFHVWGIWLMMMIWFVVRLTEERRLALFPARTIVRDPHHRESATCREQGLNLRRTRVQALLSEVVQQRYLLHHGAITHC